MIVLCSHLYELTVVLIEGGAAPKLYRKETWRPNPPSQPLGLSKPSAQCRDCAHYAVLMMELADDNVRGPKAMDTAYEASLAYLHPWVLQKTLHAAFRLAPSRQRFLQTISDNVTMSLLCAEEYVVASEPIINAMHIAFAKAGLPWDF